MADFANTPDRLWVYCYTPNGTTHSLDHMVRYGPTVTGIANALSDAEAFVRDVEGRYADIFVQVEGKGDRLARTVYPLYRRDPANFFDRCKVLQAQVEQHRN